MSADFEERAVPIKNHARPFVVEPTAGKLDFVPLVADVRQDLDIGRSELVAQSQPRRGRIGRRRREVTLQA